jgi:ribonuclease P protein component
MLSKTHRITSEKFPQVLRGKTTQNDILRIVFHHEENMIITKCAVVVNKKQAPTAVQRNHIRRKAYQILQDYLNQLSKGYLSVMIKKKNPTDEEILTSLKSLLCLNN